MGEEGPEVSILQVRILNLKNSGLEVRINFDDYYYGSEDWCEKDEGLHPKLAKIGNVLKEAKRGKNRRII